MVRKSNLAIKLLYLILDGAHPITLNIRVHKFEYMGCDCHLISNMDRTDTILYLILGGVRNP
jgi:hypothetical protein